MKTSSPPKWQSTGSTASSAPVTDRRGGETVIEVRGVGKEFQGSSTSRVVALEGVDLTIGQGELIGLVGPSGCGKSTLLNLIAGLDNYTSGDIIVEGERVVGPRQIGYVFQQDTLLPWRDVKNNAEFALEIRGTPAKERREVASRWLDKLGLGDFHDHYPHQLSGGMRKRLQLATVLAVEPGILLMDEPFGPLDAQTRTLIEDDFINLWRESGMTALFVTHDLAEAIAMCTRVVIISARPGRVKSEYEITLPSHQSTTERRLEPAFQDFYASIWADLREEVGTRLE